MLTPRPPILLAFTLVFCWSLGGCGLSAVGPDLKKARSKDAVTASPADSSEGDSSAAPDGATAPDVSGDTGSDSGAKPPPDAGPDAVADAADAAFGDALPGDGDSSVDTASLDAGDSGGDAAEDTTGCQTPSDCGGDAGACRKWGCDGGACVAVNDDGRPCDDGDACTGPDACKGAVCAPGAATVCNDGSACTLDTCGPKTGCVFKDRQDGTECSDGDACTGTTAVPANDSCLAGACHAGLHKECGDGDVCTDESCDVQKGCVYPPAQGTECEDGNACTSPDTCDQHALCRGGPKVSCEDGNACTLDWCHPLKGCLHDKDVPEGKPCDDGQWCTTKETCKSGQCVVGAPMDCGDGLLCTADKCDDDKDRCVHLPRDGVPCDDGDVCSTASACASKACVGKDFVNCDDKNPCTKDSCNKKKGCQHANLDGSPCDDGQPCTVAASCEKGACAGGGPAYFDRPWPAPPGNIKELTTLIARPGPSAVAAVVDLREGGLLASATSRIVRFDADGSVGWEVKLPKAFVASRLRPTAKGAISVGITLEPRRPYAVLVDDSGPQLKVSTAAEIDSIAHDYHPADVAAVAAGHWLSVGWVRIGDKYTMACTNTFSAMDGWRTDRSCTPIRKGYSSHFEAVSRARTGPSDAAACGWREWSPLKHRDALMVGLDKSGKVQWERTPDFVWQDGCSDLLATDEGFVLVGTGRPTGYMESGMVWKTDGAGRMLWSRVLASELGGTAQRVFALTPGQVVVAGVGRRVLAGWTGPSDQPFLARIELSAGTVVARRWLHPGMAAQVVPEAVFDLHGADAWVAARLTIGTKNKGLVLSHKNVFAQTCEKAGKCRTMDPAKCDDAKACLRADCDPAKGCSLVARDKQACNDGKPCSAAGSCAGKTCQAGGSRITRKVSSSASMSRAALVPDLEGGWIAGLGSYHNGKLWWRLERYAETGTPVTFVESDLPRAWRRVGSWIEVIGDSLRLVDAATLKLSPKNLLISDATAARGPDSTLRPVAAVDGDRYASAGTVKLGAKLAVLLRIGGAPRFNAQGNVLSMSTKPIDATLKHGSGGYLRPVGLAPRSVGGWHLLAGVRDSGDDVTGARLFRIDDSGKVTAIQKFEPKTRVLRAAGLLGDRRGGCWVALEQTTGVVLLELRRLDAEGKKVWTKTFQADSSSLPTFPMARQPGDRLVLLYPELDINGQLGAILPLDAGGRSLPGARTYKWSQMPSGMALGIASDGRVGVLSIAQEKVSVYLGDPWLHTDCKAAGACVRETYGSCEDGNPCTRDGCIAGVCTHKALPHAAPCDYGDLCYTSPICLNGKCVPVAPGPCKDKVACTSDFCVPGSGKCESVPDDLACVTADPCKLASCEPAGCSVTNAFDSTPCAEGKTCQAGVCQ